MNHFSANFSRGPKWTPWWKSKDSSWRNVKNIMEFFTRGTWPSQICYILSYTYRRMIKFCYHLSPMKPWLTLTDLGSRGFFREVSQVKKLLKKTVFKKYVPRTFLLWRFLDWLHRISSTQGVLHQVSQFRKPLKKWY